MRLFDENELRVFLENHLEAVKQGFQRRDEDEVLGRTTDDLVSELVLKATLTPLVIGAEPVDGSVKETRIDVSNRFEYYGGSIPGYEFKATYEFTGNPLLFKSKPSRYIMATHEGDVGSRTITISQSAGQQVGADEAQRQLERQIGQIRSMAEYSKNDVDQFNASLVAQLGPTVENRKQVIQKRRDLAGALGFPMQRRTDAPKPVPLERRIIGVARAPDRKTQAPYRDEPALTDAQYEDAIDVVGSTLLAMERTPSVASGKDEEDLRDQILVQLNGTFKGTASGETFVQKGKTDVLIRVEDRHVFVGECKWWTGEKAFAAAIDQLLSYLPWRDEKAALILFIDRKDATAVIEKADSAIREHPSFKRVGKSSSDSVRRRNYVLGHPGDLDREIQVAALFAVLPKD